MMAKAVTAARQPDAEQCGADGIYRSLFDSFNPDSHGRISPLEVLSRLQGSGLRADERRRLLRRGRRHSRSAANY